VKAVELSNLHYAYPDGTKALCGVDLKVNEGESVYLVGPNGSGKSTLLLHLNGTLRPQKGQIQIFGMDVYENLQEVKRKVGLVFQNPDDQLFMPTVFEDVAFGPVNLKIEKKEVERRVEKSLEVVGLVGFEKRSSHHLSYGEKKRAAIATVLAMDPEILVFDEPTLALDPWIKKNFIDFLKKVGKGRTIIVSGHDLELMKLCNQTYLMKNGRIVKKVRKKSEIFKNL